MSKILDFLFGKSPKIFDNNNNVRHDLPKETWEAWQKRYFSDPDRNWRNHSGMKARERRQKN